MAIWVDDFIVDSFDLIKQISFDYILNYIKF